MRILKHNYLFFFILLLLVFSCSTTDNYTLKQESPLDYKQVVERGRIIAIIDENSTDYFVYKGEPMGFQFDLMKKLGEYLGLEVEIIVSNNLDDDFKALYEGSADIIANGQFSKDLPEDLVSFGLPLYNTKHVLVQRKNNTSGKSLILNKKELASKNIFIPLRSSYSKPLESINKQIGEKMQVFEMPGYNTEQLVSLVANEELDYTVCDEDQAKVLAENYPELDFSMVLEENTTVSWAFRAKSPELMKKVNNWLAYYRKSSQFALLYNKYFENRDYFANTKNNYFAIRTGKISHYDDLIKKYSSKIQWDWRLLASLIYQESRFDPDVRSHAGAYGIMQLMPSTLDFFGVDSTASVEEQISAGVKLINYLDKRIQPIIPDREERIKFVLASYNIGLGHILDAVNIAGKIGKDPRKWDNNVDSCLLSKSRPEIYQLSEVKFGYAKGRETYRFVKDILARFEHYKNLVGR